MLKNLGFATSLFFFICQASASSTRWLSLKELTHQSDTVILGTVKSQESFWQKNRIYTRSRISIEEVWIGKDTSHPTIDVITLGGEVGMIGQHIAGINSLNKNDNVVIHLKQHDGNYRPVTLAQGIWHIEKDPHQTVNLSHNPITSPLHKALANSLKQSLTLSQLKQAILKAHRETP